MAYSPTGSSDLFSILSCMTFNFLFLSFSTLHSSSLWRTVTIASDKLNKQPPPTEGLIKDLQYQNGPLKLGQVVRFVLC